MVKFLRELNKFFRDLKIRSKLLILVAISFASFVLSVTIEIYILARSKVGGPLYHQIKVYEDSSERIALLKSDLNEVQMVLITMIYETDKDKLKQLETRIKEISTSINTEFQEIVETIDEEDIKAGLEDAFFTWKEFDKTMDEEIIPAIFAGYRAKASEIAFSINKRRYERFIEQVSSSVDTMELIIDEIEEKVASIIKKNILFLLVSGGILLGLVLLLMFFIVSSITKPLVLFMRVVSKVTEGNYDVKIDIAQNDEIGQLGKGLNMMTENLKILVGHIKKSSSEIFTSSTEIQSANTEMKSNIEMTRKQVANVTTSTTELTASIMQVAGNAKKVSEMAEKTKISIEETFKQTEQASLKIIEAQNKMKEAVSMILELKEYAKNINEIIEAITDISEKSDLLALNAAIEASGAGETGKRFRVVADEMRRLADSSLSSSKKISEILTNIHRGIEAVVEEGSYVSKSIEESANLINMIKLVFDNITKVFLETADKMKEVAFATEQEAKTTELLSESMQEIDKAAEQNVIGIEQSVVAVNNFLALANELNELIAQFKV